MFDDLIGKTIAKATRYRLSKAVDDEPILRLEFTDGTHCCIVATYSGYTGHSRDEYPAIIERDDSSECVIPVEDKTL